MRLLPFIAITIFFASIYSIKSEHLKDYRNHKCLRECTPQTKPMECVYDFMVEYYSVLTRNCFNCTFNQADCFRPHCVTADGVKRAIITVNRMLPGPSIQVCLGDTIVVNVENHLHSFEGTTIHWHGLRIPPHMDGVSMITQCPIDPMTTFQYRFKTVNPGTHWWHAHSAGQRADGVFGSLVVRQPNDPQYYLYDFDLAEHVIVINDWLDQLFITKFNADLHDSGDEFPSSILINGRGGDMTFLMKADVPPPPMTNKRTRGHRGGKPKPASPPLPPPPGYHRERIELPRSEFIVAKGRRYRFRMINAGIGFCPLEVSIDSHVLTIIALDGNPVEPFQVASFFILVGERVDFVVAANAYPDSYWIKVRGSGDCEPLQIFQTAILRYGTSPRARPPTKVTYDSAGPDVVGKLFNLFNVQLTNQNKNQLILVDQPRSILTEFTAETLTKIRQPPNKRFYLALDMNTVENTMVYDDSTFGKDEQIGFTPFDSPQINNITFKHPNVPLIYQYKKPPPEDFCNQDERKMSCPDDSKFCECIHTLNVNVNDLVELVIVDGGVMLENHPIHLHGFSFAVLGVEKLGPTAFMPDIKLMDQMGKLKRNFDSPPIKDTVTVPSGGYTIVRFLANRPGVWHLHCHIEFHMQAGMMLVFRVGDDSQLPPIDLKSWPQCGDFMPKPQYQRKNHN